MRRSWLMLLLAAMLLAWPAAAQDTPSRTLIAATVRVAPGENSGLCLLLDTGDTLDVSLQRVDDRDESPSGAPIFALTPYGPSAAGAAAPPEIQEQPITS